MLTVNPFINESIDDRLKNSWTMTFHVLVGDNTEARETEFSNGLTRGFYNINSSKTSKIQRYHLKKDFLLVNYR